MTPSHQQAGPFVVMHRQACGCGRMVHSLSCPALRPLYREAFATLEDAVGAAQDQVRRTDFEVEIEREDCWDLASDLGTDMDVLVLPNGDVIEVEATTWLRIAYEAGARSNSSDDDTILAAWNAKHGIGLVARR